MPSAILNSALAAAKERVAARPLLARVTMGQYKKPAHYKLLPREGVTQVSGETREP